MNKYALIDSVSMGIASLTIGKYAYFSQNVQSPRISELLPVVNIDPLNIEGEGYYSTKVVYRDTQEEAACRVAQWKGYDYPTIIYHHGAAEGSYDLSFNKILANHKDMMDANLIVVQALFNHNNREFMQSITSLFRYALLLASSTKLVEALIEQLRNRGNQRILVTGTSLGGFVTNLHFTYFHSADCYIPLLAGARLADVFLDSDYRKVTSKQVKTFEKEVRSCLNFDEDLRKRDQANLFPLLALFDRIIRYGTHSQDFTRGQVTAIPFGHATGAIKFKLLREHILSHLE
jgi:predicted esterase YcpF (UPF0227 family)